MPSNTTTDAVVTEIRDPKLRVIARNVRAMLQLSVLRVAAHEAAPSAVTLPTTGLEAVLARRFAALPADRRRRAGERATAILADDRERRFGPVSAASLRSPLPVADQIRDRLVPRDLGLTAAYLGELRPTTDAITGPGFRPLTTLTHLELRVHEVRCIDETDPEWPGGDTILLGGTRTAADGATAKIPQFKVGNDFDDGERKRFTPPRVVTTFDVTAGTAWPKTYFASLVLAEQDNGGFPAFLDEMVEGLRSEIWKALTAAIGGALGVTGGPIGVALGSVLGWAVGELAQMFKDWWEDDVFPPATVACTHGGLDARWPGGATDSPEGTLRFKGHGGTYEVRYDWRLMA